MALTEAGSWGKNGISCTWCTGKRCAGCVGLEIPFFDISNMRKCLGNVWETSKHEEMLSSCLCLYPWHFLKQVDHKVVVLCAYNCPPLQITLHFQSLVFYFSALTPGTMEREISCNVFGHRESCAITTNIFPPSHFSEINIHYNDWTWSHLGLSLTQMLLACCWILKLISKTKASFLMWYMQNEGTSSLFILFNGRNNVFIIEITAPGIGCTPIQNPNLISNLTSLCITAF